MNKNKTYYFIGINGIGMSGLAEILVTKECTVLGSDTSNSIRLDYFQSIGVQVTNHQKKENIKSKDWVIVISSAIQPKNEELLRANELGCKVIKRGDLLADIIHEYKNSIAIVGAHGKTTTTSLIIQIFSELMNPSYFVGGHLDGKSHAMINNSSWFLTELDESDGSFLKVSPSNTIITNIEHDHIDYYQNKDQLMNAFSTFLKKTILNKGCCAINIDDPLSEKLLKRFKDKKSFITYGIESKNAQVRAESIQYNWKGITFSLVINDTTVDKVFIPLFGKHNVYNALSAIAISIRNQIPLKHILNGLSNFSGVKRRLELKYKANGIMLYDDYAHHPTEVISTLEGLYKSFSKHRIITIFQPHRYSRLTTFFKDFSNSFSRSSKTYLVPVFASGETIKGHKTSLDLTNKINENGGDSKCFESFDKLVDEVGKDLKLNDIILIMGAGNITKISNQLIPIIKGAR